MRNYKKNRKNTKNRTEKGPKKVQKRIKKGPKKDQQWTKKVPKLKLLLKSNIQYKSYTGWTSCP